MDKQSAFPSKRMSSIASNVSGISPKNKFGDFSIMEEETQHKHVFHSQESSGFISALQKVMINILATSCNTNINNNKMADI